MKRKNIYFLVLCCILTACDKTENEEMLENLFINQSYEHKALTEYASVVPSTSIYSQEFNNPDNCSEWNIGENEYATYSLENGQYIIQAKKGFYNWTSFEVSANRDFQIEVQMACNFMLGATSSGLVFGVNKTKGSYGAILFGNDVPFYIGLYNGSKWEAWFNIKTAPYTEPAYRNAVHLYTIRKVGDKVSFFLDKELLYSTVYTGSLNSIGFSNSNKGMVVVDYVRVDYIKVVEE